MLPSSRLLQEEPRTFIAPAVPSAAPPTLPSIVIDDVGDNDHDDDDPPPYSSVVPPNHLGWTFDFPCVPYTSCATTSLGQEAATPLAAVQPGPTAPGSGSNAEEPDGQRAAIPVPLMPRRLFMFDSRRSLFAHGPLPFTDNISACKYRHGSRRKYGAILIGAAVIIFLMALSLLVRFVMDKNLWRG